MANNRYPDVLVVGTQKGGTGWIYRNLREHPRVYAGMKEVSYWDYKAFSESVLFKDRGVAFGTNSLNFYTEHFSQASDDELVFDISPDYMTFPWVPAVARRHMPNSKVIFMLRDPVDRAYSQYHMYCRLKLEQRDYREALLHDLDRTRNADWFRDFKDVAMPELDFINKWNISHYHTQWPLYPGYIARGVYIYQLLRWAKYYNPRNILVIPSSHALGNPQKTMERVHSFLELEPFPVRYSRVKYNWDKYHEMDEDLREQLDEFYKPYNEELARKLGLDLFG